MVGQETCCRYEPSLKDLLADEMMTPVLRSAGIDQQRFHELLAETARRIHARPASARERSAQ
jgi:hypothetical protein